MFSACWRRNCADGAGQDNDMDLVRGRRPCPPAARHASRTAACRLWEAGSLAEATCTESVPAAVRCRASQVGCHPDCGEHWEKFQAARTKVQTSAGFGASDPSLEVMREAMAVFEDHLPAAHGCRQAPSRFALMNCREAEASFGSPSRDCVLWRAQPPAPSLRSSPGLTPPRPPLPRCPRPQRGVLRAAGLVLHEYAAVGSRREALQQGAARHVS